MTEEPGREVDSSTLRIMGLAGMTEEMQKRLLANKGLHGMAVGDLVALAKDLAETSLGFAADYTFNHRIVNGKTVRTKERYV